MSRWVGCRYSGAEAGRRAAGTDPDAQVRLRTGPAADRVRRSDAERGVVTGRSATGHGCHLVECRADVAVGEEVFGQGRRAVRSDGDQ